MSPSTEWCTSGWNWHGVDLAGLVGHGRHFERVGAAGNEEPRRRRLHGIAVGHPHAGKLGQINAVPQGAGTNEPQVGGAILAGFGLFQPTTEVEGQKLHTVADAEDRHAEVKESLVQRGSVLFPTLAGPPDRMIAEGCMAFTCAAVTTQGWISE